MRLPERVWPGLRTRGDRLEAVLAVLSTVAISAGAATGDRGPVSVAVFAVGTARRFVLLLTLRRRAPLVPFLRQRRCSSVLSPAVNGALPLAALRGGPLRRPLAGRIALRSRSSVSPAWSRRRRGSSALGTAALNAS